MPAVFELLQLELCLLQRPELLDGSLPDRPRVTDPEHHEEFSTLSRLQRQISLQAPARVVAVGVAAGACTVFHGVGIVIRPVRAKERLSARVIPCDIGPNEGHPRVHCVVVQEGVSAFLRQIILNRDAQETVRCPCSANNEQRVLQVHPILVRVPLIGELTEREDRELPRPFAFVGNLQTPDLERLP